MHHEQGRTVAGPARDREPAAADRYFDNLLGSRHSCLGDGSDNRDTAILAEKVEPTSMKHLLLVYHSQSGGAEAMAQAVIAGASDPAISEVELRVRSPLVVEPDELMWAHAVILGTPENFGYMSGALKYFFDHIYYPCLERTQGLPYCLFVKAGNDGTGAVSSVTRIVTGLRWREVQSPIVVVGPVTPPALEACRELGMALAAGLEAGLF